MQTIIFVSEKIKKYRKCPALDSLQLVCSAGGQESTAWASARSTWWGSSTARPASPPWRSSRGASTRGGSWTPEKLSSDNVSSEKMTWISTHEYLFRESVKLLVKNVFYYTNKYIIDLYWRLRIYLFFTTIKNAFLAYSLKWLLTEVGYFNRPARAGHLWSFLRCSLRK